MISVNVSFIGKDVKKLTVSGHANYDKYGNDLVCAGVSAIVMGGINAFEDEFNNVEIIIQDDLLGVIVNNNNDRVQIILNTIIIQLQTIEESYAKHIKINKKRGGV